MAINKKKLLTVGRRRLGFTGQVKFMKTSMGNMTIPNLGVQTLLTCSNELCTEHTISYWDISSIAEADVYHELCHVKLNEYGFKRIETVALNRMKVSYGNSVELKSDAENAVRFVAEVYAQSLFFTYFRDESLSIRRELLTAFQSSDRLDALHRQSGFWGASYVSYEKMAFEWVNEPFPDHEIEQAIQRTTNAAIIMKEYQCINAVLSNLPKAVDERESHFSIDEESHIVESIIALFSAKTNLTCH